MNGNVRMDGLPGMRRATSVATWVAILGIGAGLAGAQSAWAGSSERQGTSGANELRIPVGPRSTALANTTVADVTGPEAMFWNPAGLATLTGTDVYFSHLSYIADMNVNYFALATKAGSFGTLGFSAKVLDVGDVIVTTEAAPDGTGEILSPTFTTLGVSYGRQFTDRVRFGATAQFVSENIRQASAHGLALDFGFQYDTGYRGMTFGFAMKNFGPSMQFSGSDFEIAVPVPDAEPGATNRTLGSTSSKFEMPSYFQMGAAYNLMESSSQQFRVLGSFVSNNFSPDEFRGGAEYSFHDRFALRAGYGRRVSDSDNDVYNGFSFGAGVNAKVGDTARLRFDYSGRLVKEFFDDTHEFAVRLAF
jgi:hypothetical protein